MSYPICHRFWIEFEREPGVWDSDLAGLKAGCDSIAEAEERVAESKQRGEPWAYLAYRAVRPTGEPVQNLGVKAEEADAPSDALGGHPASTVLPRPATGPLVGSRSGKGEAHSSRKGRR